MLLYSFSGFSSSCLLFFQHKMVRFFSIRFIAKRVYQNNTVAIPHLIEIEYVVTTRRMYKYQYVAVKHLESTVSHQSPPYSSAELFCLSLRDII